jgi:transketolase
MGRNIWFGVREHAMGAIANGMAVYGGVFPFTGTFLIFSDYIRPALRIGALMGAPVVHVFTHDSIGLGEDGPTHQPVEHLAALRAIPNYHVIRPADANETREAWRAALGRRDGPIALILTRQGVPVLERSGLGSARGLHQGAYVLWESEGPVELLLIATGSEVAVTLEAGRRLAEESRVEVRVVSIPSWELFEDQPQDYRDSVVPPQVTARLSVEAASPQGWREWVGPLGDTVGVTTFGHSAPGSRVLKEYGFNVDNIMARARSVLERSRKNKE